MQDGNLTIDFGYNYNNDTGPVAPMESDLYSLFVHEVTHILGFASLISSTGESELAPNVYSVFDTFLYAPRTVIPSIQLINPATYTFQGLPSDLTSDNIAFLGPQAMAAFGTAVPIYSPSPWSGSSLSHWADGITPEPVMSRALMDGTEKRAHQPFELGALEDLGYRLAGPPPMGVRSELWKGYR
jgi:hypothetical protein